MLMTVQFSWQPTAWKYWKSLMKFCSISPSNSFLVSFIRLLPKAFFIFARFSINLRIRK